jgi:hypothetical protein
MNKNSNKLVEEQDLKSSGNKISRKEAIKKAGLMAVSTATMMVLLNNKAEGMYVENDKNHNGPNGPSSPGGPNGYPGGPKGSACEPGKP